MFLAEQDHDVESTIAIQIDQRHVNRSVPTVEDLLLPGLVLRVSRDSRGSKPDPLCASQTQRPPDQVLVPIQIARLNIADAGHTLQNRGGLPPVVGLQLPDRSVEMVLREEAAQIADQDLPVAVRVEVNQIESSGLESSTGRATSVSWLVAAGACRMAPVRMSLAHNSRVLCDLGQTGKPTWADEDGSAGSRTNGHQTQAECPAVRASFPGMSFVVGNDLVFGGGIEFQVLGGLVEPKSLGNLGAPLLTGKSGRLRERRDNARKTAELGGKGSPPQLWARCAGTTGGSPESQPIVATQVTAASTGRRRIPGSMKATFERE